MNPTLWNDLIHITVVSDGDPGDCLRAQQIIDHMNFDEVVKRISNERIKQTSSKLEEVDREKVIGRLIAELASREVHVNDGLESLHGTLLIHHNNGLTDQIDF